MMIKKIAKFFDKLEDKIRGKLSHYPVLYAFIGSMGIVLIWRGVWMVADELSISSIASIFIGTVILLMTGVYVSAFIGSKLIISGLIGERKLSEKEELEIETEEIQIKNLQSTLIRLEKKLDHMETHLGDHKEEK